MLVTVIQESLEAVLLLLLLSLWYFSLCLRGEWGEDGEIEVLGILI
jgi:hypothetical protein